MREALLMFVMGRKLLADKNLRVAHEAFDAWIKKLDNREQLLYWSRFDGVGGFGHACGPHCPQCPPEAQAFEDALFLFCESKRARA